MKIRTNNIPRFTVDGFDLTAKEKLEFDYMEDINAGLFFRYKGNVYDIGEFMCVPDDSDPALKEWHGYTSDTYFSGVLVKFDYNQESVIVAQYFC